MKIEHEIIMAEHEDCLYVPRPTSWMGGWARHLILKRHVPRKVLIASPSFWEKIHRPETVKTLKVYADGSSSID